MTLRNGLICLVSIMAAASGCRSPYYSDQGTVAGGLGGAGLGAIIGNQSHHAGTGALIGAAAGAVTGNLVGGAMDNVEARNQAAIAATNARISASNGSVTVNDVLSMTRSGVHPDLIINHIRANGMAQPVQANELILLQQQGVSTEVISAMQSSYRPTAVAAGPPSVAVPVVAGPPVVYEYVAPPPYWGCPPPRWHYHHGPRYGWGFSVSGH